MREQWSRLVLAICLGATLASVACKKSTGKAKEQTRSAEEVPSVPEKEDAADAGCLTEAAVAPRLAFEEERIATEDDSHLIESRCDRWIYAKGDFRIIVSGKVGQVRSGFTHFTDGRVPTAECLQRAADELTALVPFASGLLAKGQALYGDAWSDPYEGAAGWAECDDDGQVLLDLLSTLLHELNHGLDKDGCIYEPTAAEHLCFDFSLWLPKGEFAGLPMTEMPAEVNNYEASTQKLYLQQNGIGFLNMLDELVCYRIDTDVQSAIIRKRGSVMNVQGTSMSRTSHHLHLFMLYTVRYMERLQRERAEQYQQTFPEGGENLQNLRDLLDLCEASREAWARELKQHDEAPLEHEDILWAMYNETKTNWLNPGAGQYD